MATQVREIPTPVGVARSYVDRTPGPDTGLLVLGHGAGGSVEAADLLAVRDEALAHGFVVARIEQPYRVAGKRAPVPAGKLDAAWIEAVRVVRRRRTTLPLIVGGRSSGARVACRTAAAVGADGVVVLAFPLHWPGKPEKSRRQELDQVHVPVLAISGERDPFGVPPEDPRRSLSVLSRRVHDLRGPMQPVREAFGEWLGALAMSQPTSH